MKAPNPVRVLNCAGPMALSFVCLVLLPSGTFAARAEECAHDHGPAPASLIKSLRSTGSSDRTLTKLPPLTEGVAELKFGEFFVMPVGPRGLEMTEKLRGLDGQRVRILGYMAQEESPVPGRFLLAAIPVQLHSHDNSLADDLPPAVVHVFPPTLRHERIPHASGLMLLTGTLSVGARDEADGRISLVRLALEPPEKFANWKIALGAVSFGQWAGPLGVIVLLAVLAAARTRERASSTVALRKREELQ